MMYPQKLRKPLYEELRSLPSNRYQAFMPISWYQKECPIARPAATRISSTKIYREATDAGSRRDGHVAPIGRPALRRKGLPKAGGVTAQYYELDRSKL